MAVKASVTVTISCYRDTDTITRYYKLQASTAQTPAKPSTLIPSGWDDTEPTYTSGSTNTLYFVDRYVFSDGTFQYTEVSKSTSYEAAKEAYNKALNAQSTANSVDNKVKKLSGDPSNYSQLNDDTAYIWGFTHDDTADGHWYTENPLARDKFISDYYDCMGGEKYLINFEISTSCKANRNNSNTDLNIGYVGTAIGLYYFNDQNVSQGITYSQRTFGSEEAPVSIISSIVTVPDNARKFRVFVQTEAWNNFSGVIKVRNIRVKKLLVQSSDVEYYLSTSSSSVTGGSWSTTAPAWVDGKYMWSRTKTTYQNGAVTYTPSENGTCIAGAKGATGNTGATGTGIDSVTEEYYLSTSKTTQNGGSWSTTPPTWSSGKYIWTRSKIVYKNPTSTSYTTPVCSSEWEAVNELEHKVDNIEVGVRNLLRKTDNPQSPYFHSTGELVENELFNNCNIRKTSTQWGGIKFDFNTQIINRNLVKPGDIFTYSIWGKLSDNETKEIIVAVTAEGTENGAYKRFINTQGVTGDNKLSTSWKRFYYTFSVPASRFPENNGSIGSFRFEQNVASSENCYVMWACPKLEKGNKPTDWSPSPEDLDNKIDNIEKRNMYIIKNSSEGYLQANGTTGLGHMDSINKEHTSEYIEVNQGETWIFQVWVTPTKASGRYLWMAYQLYDNNKSLYNTRQAYSIGDNTGTPQYYYYTINIPSGVKYIRVSARMYNDGRIKLEKNTIPTGWSLAPEDIDDKISEINKSVSEVVVGTQTTTTASWTGVASFDTLEDKQQITYWLPQTSANDVTLNLTLAGGTTTGAKPVYYSGTTRLGTHYPAGNAIRLTYRKNVTIGSTTITDGWWADANYNTNDNTYDRIRFNKPIKVKSAINAGELIVSDSNGYFKLTAGCSFNLDIPILMCATSKSAGATDSTNNYLSTPDGNIRYNTNNSWNATQYKTLYLVGDIVGNIFIVDSTTPFTTTIPTTDNNKYYISLGYMHTTYQMYLYPEHPIFKYLNGQFKNISQIAYEAFTSEIGGRNLLIGSKKYNKSNPFKINNTVINDSYLFNYFMKLTPIPNEYYVIQVKSDIPLASSHGYNTANIGKFTFWLYIRNTGTTKVWGDFDNAQMFCSNDNSDNKRYLGSKNNTYYWLYKMPSNTQDVGVCVNTYADSEHPITANFWDFKIEKGNKATDWTSPPEDEYFNDNILLKTKDMITRIGNDIINYRNSVTEDTSRLFAPNNEEICKIFKSGGAWADIGSDLKYYIQKKILNLNDIVTYSIYASTDDTSPRSLSFFCGRGSNFYYQGAPTSIRGNTLRNNFGWIRYSYTFRITQTMINDASTYPNQELACRIESNAACTEGTYVYWSAPKLEFGEYVTDWAESPEDLKNTVEEVSKYAQDTASKLLLLDNEQGTGKVNSAISRINSLEGTITNLVKDDKGMVSMTQTGSGIKLDMTPITKNINELLDAIKGVATSGDLKGLSDELKKQLQELTDRTAYINASTDNQGRPVITLGATNSPFKVEITNEAINFIQNGQIIAYANGQKFYNLRTVVQQDVQIGVGPGFIWKTRESGNMGLTWVSGS